MYVMK